MSDEQQTERGLDGRFVHLHLHSEYSLLDGANRVDRLVERVGELGMDAVAITDHGNMHAAVRFYEAARKAGIKPILGVEAYVAPGDRHDRTHTGVKDGGYHLVLLAEDEAGWDNLLYLCSEAYLTGFYYKPRMDRAILEKHSAGLIAINGHLGSEMGEHLMSFVQSNDRTCYDKAVESARWHAEVFADRGTGPCFYVELQHHIREQIAINPHLIGIARELGLPLVCDNDSHFLLEEHHDAHDSLICISTGKIKDDPDRMRYTPELYVKGPEQMWGLFGGEEYNNEQLGDAGREALNNTVRIADRCTVELPIGANHAPVVVVKAPPKNKLPKQAAKKYNGDLTAWYHDYCDQFELEPATDPSLSQDELKTQCDKALRLLCEAGMVWRYGAGIAGLKHDGIEGEEGGDDRRAACPAEEQDGYAKWARLNRELKILADKSISAYFLIVWDFVNWGRQREIPALARGSGVGTMAGFVLGLSNACPVEYGLLFERFTDPDRSEYPDIDIDLCQFGRSEVIEYVRTKYGHVAQIITFGTLKARAGIRDVARVLNMPLGDADKLAKLVPEELGITLDKALEAEPKFKTQYDEDELSRRVVDTARTLEGQARHASVHAAGVIVATRPLHEVVPLYRPTKAAENEVVTQWDGPTCEKMGLLKMDFLGLRTLTTIKRCCALIRETLPDEEIWRGVGRGTELDGASGNKAQGFESLGLGPHPLDLERLKYDDPRVFDLFARGDTAGVFQFESGGMRRLLVDMKPDRLGDLIAANALFRPGPMDLIPDYVRRKHGDAPVPKVHPIVDGFTAETYGVMVYQEQVMQIVHGLGGIPLRSAYSLIKAISKKKAKVINANRPLFIEGAQSRGLDKKHGDELFELILKFAGYGFNKSHSTGYAIVAYQTAYLKTYFPRQYMAAFLSFESQAQAISGWIGYLDDCKRTRTIDPVSGEVIGDGIAVSAPDINKSLADFAVVFDEEEERAAGGGHIRFGLKAIKGAGAKAIGAIIAERDGETERQRDGVEARPYTSLFEFCERVPPGVVNKATIEALVKSGAFDLIHGREARAAMVATIDQAVSAGQKIAADKAAGQGALFGFGGGDEPEQPAAQAETPLAKITPWTEGETLRQEKDTLGFYLSNHPLQEWQAWTRAFTDMTCALLAEQGQDKRVIVPAMVQAVRAVVIRNGRQAGKRMAILTIEDTSGQAEAVLFANVFEQFGHLLEGEAAQLPVFVLGRVDLKRGDAQVIVDRLVPIDGCPLEKGKVQVLVRANRLNGSGAAALTKLGEALDMAGEGAPQGADLGAAAKTPIEVVIETDEAWISVKPACCGGSVVLGPALVRAITGELGEGSVRLAGGVTVELNKEKRWGKRG